MSTEKHDPRSPAELSALASFDFHSRTRLVFGNDSVERVGELARQLPAKRILLVTDSGIVAAGHADRVRKFLEKENLAVFVFDQVQENPTTRCVDRCLEVAKKNQIDAIVGLGGGSSMDTAKGCNLLLTNGGAMKDYWGVGKATKPMLPLIAVPTTAGTGSECQSAALIADEITHQKMACLDPKAAARIAILDPLLTLSQPPRVTACTGVDAMAHALETAVTTKRNPHSDLYSREAFRLIAQNFKKILQNSQDVAARGRMLLGAAFAGTAIENSMLGAVHAGANPLTAHFGIAHGQAVGMLLPHVVKFNASDWTVREIYEGLFVSAEIPPAKKKDVAADVRKRENAVRLSVLEKLVDWLDDILQTAGMPASLEECGVVAGEIPNLSQEAASQWTAQFNPRPVAASDFETLYRAAFCRTK